MMTPWDAYLADPTRPAAALPAPASPAEAARTWVTASRDTERDAWRALYTALYPPPPGTNADLDPATTAPEPAAA